MPGGTVNISWALRKIKALKNKNEGLALLLLLLFSHYMCLTLLRPHGVAHNAPLSMEFPRQEYWSGLPFPSPGDLPDPGIGPKPPALAGGCFTTEPSGKTLALLYLFPNPKSQPYLHFLKI